MQIIRNRKWVKIIHLRLLCLPYGFMNYVEGVCVTCTGGGGPIFVFVINESFQKIFRKVKLK